MRKLILGVCLCMMLTGCMRALLVAENRDGLIVFYRKPFQQRQISDVSAQEYCQRLQKPMTWISTVMKKGGGFHDSYKCGIVPPAKMSMEDRDDRYQADTRYEEREDDRYRPAPTKRDSPISGDYFGSRRSSDTSNNW